MAELKEWAVELVEIVEHEYTVLARTAEEAESLAEELLDAGEEGTICGGSVESIFAVAGFMSAENEEFEVGERIEFEP